MLKLSLKVSESARGAYLNLFYNNYQNGKVKQEKILTFGNVKKIEELPNSKERINTVLSYFNEDPRFRYAFMANNQGISWDFNYDGFISSISLSHIPIRKIWEILELDRLFINIKKKNNRSARNSKKKKFPEIGYDIDGTVFMLAAERILNPASKIKSLENSKNQYFNYNHISKDNLYDSLDVLALNKDAVIKHLNKKAGELVTRKAYVALYDVTTFYFESFEEDELRRRGMSKDHKTNETQVVLGLLVDADGIPFTYSLYPGNTAEVHTLIKVVDDFKREYDLDEVIVVADAGLNQMRNLTAMSERGLKWIVKYPPYTKLTQKEKDELLLNNQGWVVTNPDPANTKRHKEIQITKVFQDENKEKHYVTGRCFCIYSSTRFRKDMEEIHQKENKAKEYLLNRPYALKVLANAGFKNFIMQVSEGESEIKYALNHAKIENKMRWAGYTAIFTNVDNLEASEIFKISSQLWRIEECFRCYKTTLETRPIYVRKPEHIHGHFLLCYISLFMLKLGKRLIEDKGLKLSDEQFKLACNARSVVQLGTYTTKNGDHFVTKSINNKLMREEVEIPESELKKVMENQKAINKDLKEKVTYLKELLADLEVKNETLKRIDEGWYFPYNDLADEQAKYGLERIWLEKNHSDVANFDFIMKALGESKDFTLCKKKELRHHFNLRTTLLLPKG